MKVSVFLRKQGCRNLAT